MGLIGAGSGILFLFPPLISSRPAGGEPRLSTFYAETIHARLWQDPLGVVNADYQKDQKRGSAHSVESFQDLFIRKCWANPSTRSSASDLQVLGIMIPGGPYVEDVERRLRCRRAVIEGLLVAGYDPQNRDEIGYFCVPWHPLEPNFASCVRTLERIRTEDESRSGSTDSRDSAD